MRKQIYLTSKLFRNFSKINPVNQAIANKQLTHYCEYSNDMILQLSIIGDQDAREERLIREIMAVENKSWQDSQNIFEEMIEQNRKSLFLIKLPYYVGIYSSLAMGFGSFLFIYDLNTVQWFNKIYVTTDVPPMEEIKNAFMVSSWSWGWMEPILGQFSFFLLTMQFARNQMQNLEWKPYTQWVKNRRANNMTLKYPKYDQHIVYNWSFNDHFDKRDNKNNSI